MERWGMLQWSHHGFEVQMLHLTSVHLRPLGHRESLTADFQGQQTCP